MTKKSAPTIRVPNPHSGSEIGIDLLRRILGIAGITVDDWNAA